ncbi:hypothetical protein FDG2_5690 [Candidatus Protofrankia californiensis]|uniref:Uncharacterized protein n=1 Tax=Candidatus Protofrankia californiensis TaxID=1839754 RepID=A0A1C3PF54_9ACTN|nr:hypothetical protein FDG2_5690 [Candidatus Protofrankia californiensis]
MQESLLAADVERRAQRIVMSLNPEYYERVEHHPEWLRVCERLTATGLIRQMSVARAVAGGSR